MDQPHNQKRNKRLQLSHLRNWAFVTFLCIALGGCTTDQSGDSHLESTSTSTTVNVDDLELKYLIGPKAAREIGYRIDWQQRISGRGIKLVDVQHDSVFILDQGNFLTRLNREDGNRMWRIPVAGPIDEIQGINFQPQHNHVILIAGGSLFVLDADTGSQLQKQKLDLIANTPAIELDQFLIYGSRNGQLCWHSHLVNAPWKSYQISQSVQLPPLLEKGLIIGVGNDGLLMVLQAATAQQLWSRKLFDPVVSSPAVGGGVLFVAGLDHTLWAFDLNEKRAALWHYLTESPLTDSPVLINNRIYQQIPSQGLVCFDAYPVDSPGGVVLWTASETRGNVVSLHKKDLCVWDDDSRLFSLLEAQYGDVVTDISLPAVDYLKTTDINGTEIIAADRTGRVIRLVKR